MHSLLVSVSPICKTRPPSIFNSILRSSPRRKIKHFSRTVCSVFQDSTKIMPEVAHDYSPFLRIYTDGYIERLMGTDIVPPSLENPETNVQCKDVVYLPEYNLSSRLYLPKNANPNNKLPLLIYLHGGGFCIQTPFSATYHNYVNTLVEEANILAVSVHYRRPPEDPLPIAYDDSWTALKWVASHVNGDGPEEWLNDHADLSKVFLAGDSAGGNIAHQIVMRNGQEKLSAVVNISGIVLIHPYFWGVEPIGKEAEELEKGKSAAAIWYFACPTTSGCDDPLINPLADPKLASLGCSRVLVIVAEKDLLRDRGWAYYEELKKNGWGGAAEIMENIGEDHVFHLDNPTCQNAVAMLKKISSFINEDQA